MPSFTTTNPTGSSLSSAPLSGELNSVECAHVFHSYFSPYVTSNLVHSPNSLFNSKL